MKITENFLSSTGVPITRSELMMILHSLQNITIKASYYSSPQSAQLIEFGLEISGENLPPSVIMASSVEQCFCPAPYSGPSCQHCAPGYYRVQTGSFLGACVPCECNGHSGSCDPDTGVCFDCQHSTHGDHCELCEEGHYGNATDGSPYSCMPCQCPFSPTNNFATGCQVSEYGQLLSCDCKPGYAGDRCDRCAAGYFGEPQRPGGSCKPCDCNNNNNLTDSRACHPITGDCYLCENNTDGRRCSMEMPSQRKTAQPALAISAAPLSAIIRLAPANASQTLRARIVTDAWQTTGDSLAVLDVIRVTAASQRLPLNAMEKLANARVDQERLDYAVNTVNTVSGTMESMDVRNAIVKPIYPWVPYAMYAPVNATVRKEPLVPDVTNVYSLI
ncbi:laminin EGF-like protein [Ancylostoma duodenale]|uniref:Laminin EGF-like protein n=1 Tax=Ancylostoma duodenale TaxID=51022 RepID=A0A0C2GS91_9BILA|nr:laminin EGF-like protein [Ancylostoma duodenale]